jgi:hypothetical protein
MGITAAIIAALGAISAALGVVTILDVTPEAIFSNKLTWPFWMALSVVLILLSIVFLMGRRPLSD